MLVFRTIFNEIATGIDPLFVQEENMCRSIFYVGALFIALAGAAARVLHN